MSARPVRLVRSLALWASISLVAIAAAAAHHDLGGWTAEEKSQIEQLSIAHLPPPPADPSNRYADDARAAELGRRLFFDTRFSANGKVACASCHDPGKQFQDGLPFGVGVGKTDRRTMTVIGTAHTPWLFWDGRKDSQWSQALGPLESAVEHGGNRTQYAQLIAAHYRADYEAIFGKLPALERRDDITRVFANMGKAIAAYERKLDPAPARFDAYAQALERGDAQAMSQAMNRDEIAGLKLFVGKANCVRCHSGPLFTNNEFHNTGIPAAKGKSPDTGRADGAKQVLEDEFNCLGRYSDAKPQQCGELRFLEADARQAGQFRVPSLRNVASRAPYMHASQFATLEEAVAHYDRAPKAAVGRSELEPIGLSAAERAQLVAFLKTLDSGVKAEAKWLQSPAP